MHSFVVWDEYDTSCTIEGWFSRLLVSLETQGLKELVVALVELRRRLVAQWRTLLARLCLLRRGTAVVIRVLVALKGVASVLLVSGSSMSLGWLQHEAWLVRHWWGVRVLEQGHERRLLGLGTLGLISPRLRLHVVHRWWRLRLSLHWWRCLPTRRRLVHVLLLCSVCLIENWGWLVGVAVAVRALLWLEGRALVAQSLLRHLVGTVELLHWLLREWRVHLRDRVGR